MRPPRFIRQAAQAFRPIEGKQTRRELARTYRLPDGFKRIYQYHIRKTAGTSIAQGFLGAEGGNGEGLYDEFYRTPRGKVGWEIVDGRVFVFHNKRLIEGGDYYYGQSHLPAHELRLPPDTFTLTCLRDPSKRIISHYRMLVHFRKHKLRPDVMPVEGKWLGDSFGDFLQRIPKDHFFNQLYTFSKDCNIEEAFEKIIRLDHILTTEKFESRLDGLGRRLNLNLGIYHAKSHYDDVSIDAKDLRHLREMLDAEYRLIERVKDHIE